MKLFTIWKILTTNSFQILFASRVGGILFLFAKILRFLFFSLFLWLLISRTNALAGYTIWEVLLFYLTYSFIDAVTQMLFREVYRFREQIVNGSFDLMLVKPVNVLFRALFGGADFLDFITLIPLVGILMYVGVHIPSISALGILSYITLIANAFLIAISFHIIVLALAILTTEIDHAIMMYRDITGLGKVPIEVYAEPMRFLMTFIFPVGIMMTFPVKALIGHMNPVIFLVSISISVLFFMTSIVLWQHALRRYTSYSS